MKRKELVSVLILLLGLIFTTANAQETGKGMPVFPPAKEGYEKVVLRFPEMKGVEHLYQVAFYIGKEMKTDTCNEYTLIGTITSKHLQDNPEFLYYNVQTKGQVVSTLMLCPDEKEITQFVHFPGEMIPYNSTKAFVFYIPEGFELRYKKWKTDDKWSKP